MLMGAEGDVFVALDVKARDGGGQRVPLDLAIVIDRSGSMMGDKIQGARAAAAGLIKRLGDADHVTLVQYDDAAQVVVPMTAMNEAGKAAMVAALPGVLPGGGTNLSAGLTLGRDEVLAHTAQGHITRVILLSDGQANEGITDPQALAQLAANAAEGGLHVTTIGLGLDYNEDLMEALAERGRGQYYYVRDAFALDNVFAGELRSLETTVATSAELRLTPGCTGVTIAEVYGYEVTRSAGEVRIPLSDLVAGETRKVVARLRVQPGSQDHAELVQAVLSARDPRGGAPARAQVGLGVAVTSDAQAASAAVDGQVMGAVEQVQSAQTMRRAATAFDRGDRTAALGLLSRQREENEKAAAAYNIPGHMLKDVNDDMKDYREGMAMAAPKSEAGKELVKKSKAGAWKLSRVKEPPPMK
jgi:Ca-activated chloride channel family protein